MKFMNYLVGQNTSKKFIGKSIFSKNSVGYV